MKEQLLAKQVRALSERLEDWRRQAQAPQSPGTVQARLDELAADVKALRALLEGPWPTPPTREDLLRATNTLLQLPASTHSSRDYLAAVVALLHQWTGCRCAAIRVLDKQGRSPFEAVSGFSQEFCRRENGLWLKRDQCVCTRLMLGQPDPQDLPLMRPSGAFCVNHSSEWAKGLTDAQRQRYRGTCLESRFESAAMIPIRHEGRTLGLLHLADEAPDRLSPGVMELLEALAPLIGTSLHHLQLESALRESERNLRWAEQLAHVGYWARNLVTGQSQWSEETFRILGLAPRHEPLDSSYFYQFLHPEDRDRVVQAISQAVEAVKPFNEEFRVVRPDGNVRTLNYSGEVSCDDSGKPVRFFGAVLDITDRKEAEEALRQSEQRYHRLFEVESDAILIADCQTTRILEANAAALALYGYSRSEFLGLKATELSAEPAKTLQFFATRTKDVPLRWHRKKDGSVFPVEISCANFEYQGRDVHVAAIRDITARKKAEQALVASEERYRFLAESIPHLVWSVGPDGRGDYNNARVLEYFGKHREEMDRKVWLSALHPDDLERTLAAWQTAFSSGTEYRVESRFCRADGQYRWHHCHAVPLRDATGQIVRWFGTSTDIHDRRVAEEELRVSREQLRALAARVEAAREEERTQLAREIHDVLAQELTRLKLDLAWLNRRLSHQPGPVDPAPLQDKLTAMLAATDTAVATVQRIATELRPVVLDTLGLCAAIEWQAQDFQTRSGILCSVQLPAAPLTLAPQHSTVLFRILQESLTNVVRHAQATRVDICLQSTPERITLTIQDNGRGFEARRLSDPHALGLLGMRERAALQGGRCDITARPGAGTTVQVWLPLVAATPPQNPSP